MTKLRATIACQYSVGGHGAVIPVAMQMSVPLFTPCLSLPDFRRVLTTFACALDMTCEYITGAHSPTRGPYIQASHLMSFSNRLAFMQPIL